MSVLFLKRFLQRPRQVASIIPSSRTLIRRVMEKMDFSSPRVIAEYGPGEGCHTREIVRRMHPESRLLLFELDAEFAGHLKNHFRHDARVTVLNADCSALRFCSAMPACAQTIVDDSSADHGRWGIVSGKLNGKPVALFLCGAAERNASYDQNPPPSVNARQPKFGGGATDGYALLLDLSK